MVKRQGSTYREISPQKKKTLENVLVYRIQKEFPRIGGPRIQQLCAQMILEIVHEHMRPREHVKHGQVLWMAVSANNPPKRNKPLTETHLVPVILDVSVPEDIDRVLDKVHYLERLLAKAIRLCNQAYEQGGLLANSDLSEILQRRWSVIGHVLAEHERKTGKVVPRRATLHDMGSGITHKRIICWKRYVDGKSPEDVACETYHSLDAVDRYLGQYDRVHHCQQQDMSAEQTAYMLNCSLSLVQEYLSIEKEIEGQIT